MKNTEQPALREIQESWSMLGRTITFDSPLFGLLEAVVLDVQGEMITVMHPLTHFEATIPTAWITEIKDAG